MAVENPSGYNIPSREYFVSHEGQEEVSRFIENLRAEVGNPTGYLETCKRADSHIETLDSKKLEELFARFESLAENTPPGHDINHIRRDTIAGLAIPSNDPFVKSAFSEADIQAGILGSIFHDIGTAIFKRYEDNHRKIAHAEVGAYIFWKLSEGVINEDLRKLATYAIAAHTHFLKPLPVKDPPGYERQPYWYEIFYPQEGRPCGLGPIITRFSDRLDANGASHVVRTILSHADHSEAGGSDFAGEQGFFEINKESLVTFFHPYVREGKPMPQSGLEHTLMFANSNFGNSVYSRDDHLFPFAEGLMRIRVDDIKELIRVVGTPPDMMEFSEAEGKLFVKSVMKQISGSNDFERSWQVLSQVWDGLNPEIQARWVNGARYIQRSYTEWVNLLLSKAPADQKEFAQELAGKCLQM